MDLWTNTLAVLSKRDSECVITEKPVTFYQLGNSISSMVSGRGTPLVSGSRSTKPPAMIATAPVPKQDADNVSVIAKIILIIPYKKS